MIEDISNALKPVLEAVEVDGDTIFAQADVIPHPPTNDQGADFSAFPAVSYFYDGTESDYSTVTENRRDVVFALYIYCIWEAKALAEQYPAAYKVVDAVIDALDMSNDLGIDAVMLRPVPGEMRRVSTDRGTGLMCHIRLVASYDRQVQGFGS
jgi:hypothetical protein